MKYVKQKLKTLIDVTDLITVHYFEFSKNFQDVPEQHDFWELHYLDKGNADYLIDNQSFSLKQGQMIFFKPLTDHQIFVDKDDTPNVCVISFSCNSKAMNFFVAKPFQLTADQKLILRRFLDEANMNYHIPYMQPELKKLMRKKDPPIAGLQMLKIRLELLLIDMYRSNNFTTNIMPFLTFNEEYNDDLVNKIISFMSSDLSSNVCLNKLCSQFGYSKTYICNHFKKVTNKTIFNFLIELKINTAKYFIRTSALPNGSYSQLSDLLGFSSSSHFFHQFKKQTGLTPSEYSKSVKQYDSHPPII